MIGIDENQFADNAGKQTSHHRAYTADADQPNGQAACL
jgi:hypothetical protein